MEHILLLLYSEVCGLWIRNIRLSVVISP